MEYRKRKLGDTWHWSKECSKWPTINYLKKISTPNTGIFCKECNEKTKQIKT